MTDTVNLGLPCIEGSQAQKHVTHNDALRILDTLVQLAVLDRDLTAPPSSPAEGQRWIVKTGATGAWAGHVNAIAAWQDGAWQFSAPRTGWIAFVADEGTLLVWNGTAWGDFFSTVTSIQNLSLLGVGTTADVTNPFSAKLNNALFVGKTVAEGGDGTLRYKLSKESAAKTLSFLFQDNYSGRAEIGLTGDDDFHFKVSPDGTTWYEGIRIAAATGAVTFPNTTIAGGRTVLTANRAYYVRTDGSDSNNGLANTSGGAWLTWQHAYDTICASLDLAGYTVTVQVADGTYNGALAVNKTWLGGGIVFFSGNSTTPANVLLSVTSVDCINASVPLSGILQLKHFKLTTTTGGSGINVTSPGVKVVYDNLDFGAVAGGGSVHIGVYAPGSSVQGVTGGTGYKVSGAAAQHWHAAFGGNIQARGVTITLTGTPTFSSAFAYADTAATLYVDFLTFSGSATGARYGGSSNAVIYTGGGGASYFPGSSAGSTTTGGQYV